MRKSHRKQETELIAHPATRGSNNSGEEEQHSCDERTRRWAAKSTLFLLIREFTLRSSEDGTSQAIANHVH